MTPSTDWDGSAGCFRAGLLIRLPVLIGTSGPLRISYHSGQDGWVWRGAHRPCGSILLFFHHPKGISPSSPARCWARQLRPTRRSRLAGGVGRAGGGRKRRRRPAPPGGS
eukprot:8925167-Pyramimonas_sp.AAC.1